MNANIFDADSYVHGIRIQPPETVENYRRKLTNIISDAMGSITGLLDPAGIVLDINAAALDFSGTRITEIAGRPFWKIFGQRFSQISRDVLEVFILRAAKGECIRWDIGINSSVNIGDIIIIEISLRPVFDHENNVVFIYMETRDLHGNDGHNEVAVKSAGIKGRYARIRDMNISMLSPLSGENFLMMLSHELREPLCSLNTALQSMKKQSGNNIERSRISLERQVNDLIRLVDELLDISQRSSACLKLNRDIIEISTVVNRGIEAVSPLIELHLHSLELKVPNEGLLVNGDPEQLFQVVFYLLTNAAKYTPIGGKIVVDAIGFNDEVVLNIQDSGIGIAPQLLRHVFESFVGEQRFIERLPGGMRLRLAIVQNLVNYLGGSISARSDGTDLGSVITLRLPRVGAGELDQKSLESSGRWAEIENATIKISTDSDDFSTGNTVLRDQKEITSKDTISIQNDK